MPAKKSSSTKKPSTASAVKDVVKAEQVEDKPVDPQAAGQELKRYNTHESASGAGPGSSEGDDGLIDPDSPNEPTKTELAIDGLIKRVGNLEEVVKALVIQSASKESLVPEGEESEYDETLEERLTRIESGLVNITRAVEKFASLGGWGNYLREFKLERWLPSKKDMRRGG